MKRAYIFQWPDNQLDRTAGQTFWEIKGKNGTIPIWDLGDGMFQVIADLSDLPEELSRLVLDDIRDIDKAPEKKAALSEKYQATRAAVSADLGKGIPAKAARLIPLPRVVLLGQVPEDLVADEKAEDPKVPVDPKLGEEGAIPK